MTSASSTPASKSAASDQEAQRGDASGAILVTGVEGRFSRRLVRRLHRYRKVIGMGARPARGFPVDVVHHQIDPLRSAARSAFGDGPIDAVVHLGVVHDPHAKRAEAHSRNLLAFQRVIEYAKLFHIPKVVLLSSANTYGPRAENAQYLTERAPLLAGGTFTEMHALVELDMYAQSCFWRDPELEIVILRPANILGTVRNAPSNYLRLPVVTTLMGFDPMVQAVHQEDVVSAIELALTPGISGIYNIAGPLPVPLSRALDILERKRVSVPYTLAKGGLSGLFRLGVSKFPAPELDFIRYVCMVDDSTARKSQAEQGLGYVPKYDLQETLRAVDEERWVG